MKVVVLGANGLVGRSLIDRLSCYEWDLVALGRSELNITNRTKVFEVLQSLEPQIVINAAAYTKVDAAEDDSIQAYLVNRDGAKNVAEAVNDIRAHLVHFSTDYVFSGEKSGQYLEEDAVQPKGVYGASKLAGEKAVLDSCSKSIVVRTSWVFGEYGSNFVKTMLRLTGVKSTLDVVADQVGGPTYAGDLALLVVKIAKAISNGSPVVYGVYHYAGQPAVSWWEFAQVIFHLVESKGLASNVPHVMAINSDEFSAKATRPKNSILNCNKALSAFGVESSDWQAALPDVIENIGMNDEGL